MENLLNQQTFISWGRIKMQGVPKNVYTLLIIIHWFTGWYLLLIIYYQLIVNTIDWYLLIAFN